MRYKVEDMVKSFFLSFLYLTIAFILMPVFYCYYNSIDKEEIILLTVIITAYLIMGLIGLVLSIKKYHHIMEELNERKNNG